MLLDEPEERQQLVDHVLAGAVGASVCAAGFGRFAAPGRLRRGAAGSPPPVSERFSACAVPLCACSVRSRSALSPGGGAVGTGIGRDASLLARPSAGSTRPLGRAAAFVAFFESFTARRLIGPRTGTRGTNTQPTLGTGLPPMSRPSSNSHS